MKKRSTKNLQDHEDPRNKILKILRQLSPSPVKSSDITSKLNLSRQMVARYLEQLTNDGLVSKSGSTKSASYTLGKSKQGASTRSLTLIKKLKGLEEDLVFSEVSLKLGLTRLLSKNSFEILKYAFTEMLNNAIDHSAAATATITVSVENKNVAFEIVDKGIGAFERVRSSFALKNQYEAMEHLFKGKQSTDPRRHSGQGIFFTSRIADEFILSANKVSVKIVPDIDDVFMSEVRAFKGTQVRFRLSRQSKKSLKKLFERFSNDEFEFDRDEVRIKLSQHESLLSRSQAKRLLIGLEKFSRIEFDFKDVHEIGQAFADEIFRVYQNSHPTKLLTYANANSAIAFFIERAKRR